MNLGAKVIIYGVGKDFGHWLDFKSLCLLLCVMKKNNENFETHKLVLFWISLFIVVFSLVLLFAGPELVKCRLQEWGISTSKDAQNAGQIGDVFGGTLGPFIGWLAAVLTFAAFWVQYTANEEQRKQFNKSIIDTSVDRFETRFLTMIEIHRGNVESLELGPKASGRRAFESIFLELKMIYWLVYNCYHDSPEDASPDFPISDDLLFQIAYLFFFFGASEQSIPLISELVGPTFEQFIQNLQDYFISVLHPEMEEGDERNIFVSTDNGDLYWNNEYEFLSGHLTNLSHYIRHLFQSVKLVDDADIEIISEERKYEFVSNLRAQLSVYEQALLYYNSLSVLGEPWLAEYNGNEENYFVKYCMIKSLPLGLADFYKAPSFPEKNI